MRCLILLIGFLVLSVSSACSEEPVTRYATIEDAKTDGLFERGWVPPVLPDAAGPLVEAHNIDTNARCALAEFPRARFDEVMAALSREGFQRHDAAVPSPPLGVCPFRPNDFRDASTVLHRVGTGGSAEFVALGESGKFMFMGIP